METTVTAKTHQCSVSYENDAQAQRVFAGMFSIAEACGKTFKKGEVIGTYVKELGAYLNAYDGFTTWYVVRDTTGVQWLVHQDNVSLSQQR